MVIHANLLLVLSQFKRLESCYLEKARQGVIPSILLRELPWMMNAGITEHDNSEKARHNTHWGSPS